MLRALEPAAHCRFLPEFYEHEVFIQHVEGKDSMDKWKTFVIAWTQRKY